MPFMNKHWVNLEKGQPSSHTLLGVTHALYRMCIDQICLSSAAQALAHNYEMTATL